jgi:type I restriction enzyme M protein
MRLMADSSITQRELEARLWGAANSLRGPVDAADFKAYVFPLLFYKWISDTWDMEHAEAVGDFGEDVSPDDEAAYHRFVVPDRCHWSDLQSTTKNVGANLQRILDWLQQANPDKLAGIFGDVAWGNKERLPEPSLLSLIDTFDALTLNPKAVPNDMLGAAYEYLLKQFADESGRKAGEFFTPRGVVILLVKILDPQPEETVYDPACGSGGMLVETIHEVREKGGDARTLRLYGQEVNLTTASIARMNLYLHGIEDFQILRGDTLRDPRFRDPNGATAKFDAVIANPPFSLKNWGADTWAADPRALFGVPPASSADFAWVQHMVASMKPEAGRVGVVMPHGVLFRGGAEKQIRQGLVQSDHLEAVIGLPPNLFYSTNIPACLLIFRAAKPVSRSGVVLFIDGSKQFTKGKNQNHLSVEGIKAIVTAYRSGQAVEGDGGVPARLVEHAEIKEQGWDLNVVRYLTASAAEGADVATALARLAEAQRQLREAEQQLAERLRAAGYA